MRLAEGQAEGQAPAAAHACTDAPHLGGAAPHAPLGHATHSGPLRGKREGLHSSCCSLALVAALRARAGLRALEKTCTVTVIVKTVQQPQIRP